MQSDEEFDPYLNVSENNSAEGWVQVTISRSDGRNEGLPDGSSLERMLNATPAQAGDVGELIERLEFAQEWLRKPDHADHFSMADMARWVNDRPFNTIKAAANALRDLTAQVERLEAEIVGESATAHVQEARAKELETALEAIARWAWKTEAPGSIGRLSDEERFGMIKYHPTVTEVAKRTVLLEPATPSFRSPDTGEGGE